MDYDYNRSDSSGTDDDLPPPHQHRFARNARVTGNGRSAVSASTYPRMPNNDMETKIHLIEQEAYCCVLRAFKAQADALTWEKESLITELRKELRVSVDEHRDSLSRVNSDDLIKEIRDWRQSNKHQHGLPSSFPPVHESVPTPTVSASRKKQKSGQSVPALSGGGALTPANGMHPSLQPSSSNLKRGPPPGSRGKKAKESMPHPSPAVEGRPQVNNHSASGTLGANDPDKNQKIDQLIGKRVWTRWPYDNSFYEALITDYKEGLHALVYDMNTEREAWEWVNLKEISPEDIRWDGEEAGLSHQGSRAGQGRGSKKFFARGGGAIGAGRGRGTLKGHSKKDSFMPQNGVGRKRVGEFKLLNTDALIKEVENVFSATNPDPTEVEKAMKLLKEHEEALAQAIALLQDASDGESDEEHQDSLSKVNTDDTIKRLRDLRQSIGHQEGKLSSSLVHESVSSPTVSAPLKKQKTSHSAYTKHPLFDAGALPPPNAKHPSVQSSSSNLKCGRPPVYPAVPRRPQGNEPDKAQKIDQHIGKKVWIRWPDDDNFYEALITDYKEGQHALVYDMNTENESWEWLNLKAISPEDIRWDSQEPRLGSRVGQDRRFIRALARGGGIIGPVKGRGKGRPKKNSIRPQNGIDKKGMEIRLPKTQALIRKVEEVFSANNPDPTLVEKAKSVLDEHERALSQAIALLEDASDGESDGEDHQGKSDRKRKYDEIAAV